MAKQIKDETIFFQPNYVGGYKIGNGVSTLQFNFLTKPNWFHRKMMKLCLGWKWVDNK
jgi:hypothetical protein